MPRRPGRRRPAPRPLSLLGALAVALASLTGCGDSSDPLASFANGTTVSLQGVIHVPTATHGDYRARRLRVQLSTQPSQYQIDVFFQQKIPEATFTLSSTDLQTLLVELPLGMSLAEGNTILGTVAGVQAIYPDYETGTSSQASLVTSTSDGFVHDASRLTFLAVEDRSVLTSDARSWYVRVLGRTSEGTTDVSPSGAIQALAIERLEPHRITLTGTLATVGGTCRLLLLDGDASGPAVALLGDVADSLYADHALGSEVTVVGEDLGMSSEICSGGLRLGVVSYSGS